MGNDFYDNLLEVTNNIDDITTEKYGVITELDGIYCSVKETDNDLEHNNVPILNGANLSVGDKVILGFLNNSIYDVVCYGALDKTVHDDSKQDLLVSGQNIKTINHTSILGSGNIDIQGGGSDVDIVTSWEPTPSDTKVPSEKLTKDTLDTKVDRSSTTGLLKNDGSVDTTAYSTFDGNYNSLTNKPTIPTIPTNVSAFANDVGYLTQHQSLANYIQKSSTSGLLKNDGTVDTTSYLSSLPSHTHDGRYYTESEMDGLLNNKLDVEDAFSGSYNDLSDVPTSFNPSSHNHSISDVSNLQTSLNAKLETGDVGSAALSNDYYDLDNLPSLFDGDYDSLTNKPSIPSKTSELTNDGDGTNVFVKNNDSRLSDSRTPTSHRASATTYGVGNASYYGHCRVINNLTKSSHTDGYALSAYQGYILKQDVDGKASSTHNHTKSDITDFPTLHTVATSGSYNDLLDKPNIPSGVVVDLNLDGTSNNAVANSAVVGGLNDKIEASDISFGFDADTKEIYIEVK